MPEGLPWSAPAILWDFLLQVAGVITSILHWFGLEGVILVLALIVGRVAVGLAYEKYDRSLSALTPAGHMGLQADIRLVALGAATELGRVAVVTRKPLSTFRTRLIQLAGILFVGRVVRFFHADMDVTELANYSGKFKLVLTGHFDGELPAWTGKLKTLSGMHYRGSPSSFFGDHPRVHVPTPRPMTELK